MPPCWNIWVPSSCNNNAAISFTELVIGQTLEHCLLLNYKYVLSNTNNIFDCLNANRDGESSIDVCYAIHFFFTLQKSYPAHHQTFHYRNHIEIVPTALEEYADIIDGTVNNSYFYENGGVHVVDVPLGAVLVLLQELLHHEKHPQERIEAGGVAVLVEQGEDVRADGGVVAAVTMGWGRSVGGRAVVPVPVEHDGRGAAGGDLLDDPAHEPSDPEEEEPRLLLPPPQPLLVAF